MADDLCNRWVDVGVMYLACAKPALHDGKHRTALTTMAGRRVWIEWEMEPLSVAEFQADIINRTGA